MQKAQWQISDGCEVRFWMDRWLPSFPLGHPIPRGPVPVTLDTRVQTFLCPITRSWDLNSLIPFLSTEELDDVTGSDVGVGSGLDCLIWPETKTGVYKVKSRYLSLQTTASPPLPSRPSMSRTTSNHVWKII
ncbi:hypothetical protein ACFX16_023300 [Malus domestica]